MSWTPLRAIDAALAPTHVLLGALSDPPRLNKDAGAAIEDPGNDVMFGAASSSAAAAFTAKLPAHHRDPFDRLLIAQAITEPAVQPTKVPFIAGTDAHPQAITETARFPPRRVGRPAEKLQANDFAPGAL